MKLQCLKSALQLGLAQLYSLLWNLYKSIANEVHSNISIVPIVCRPFFQMKIIMTEAQCDFFVEVELYAEFL